MLTENRARHHTRPRVLRTPADRAILDLRRDRPVVARHPRLLLSLLNKSTRIASC